MTEQPKPQLPQTCWVCGKPLVRSDYGGRLMCQVHSTRGAAHLRTDAPVPQTEQLPTSA